jgi:chromate transporter
MLTKLASFSQRQALAVLASAALPVTSAIATASFSLSALFVSFVKIGSVVFGSGYVLIAFLRSSIVVEQGWLTDRQLLDAVAVGQLTPGPVFTTATFIGYVLGGLPGAVVATAGIFLPSFALVAATRPLLSRIRRSRAAGAFLDGANVASLGLMAAVVVHLARGASVDGASTAIGIVALVVSFATRPNPAWLVAAGAIVGAAWKLASPSP